MKRRRPSPSRAGRRRRGKLHVGAEPDLRQVVRVPGALFAVAARARDAHDVERVGVVAKQMTDATLHVVGSPKLRSRSLSASAATTPSTGSSTIGAPPRKMPLTTSCTAASPPTATTYRYPSSSAALASRAPSPSPRARLRRNSRSLLPGTLQHIQLAPTRPSPARGSTITARCPKGLVIATAS